MIYSDELKGGVENGGVKQDRENKKRKKFKKESVLSALRIVVLKRTFKHYVDLYVYQIMQGEGGF
jgi:hypothetical protein